MPAASDPGQPRGLKSPPQGPVRTGPDDKETRMFEGLRAPRLMALFAAAACCSTFRCSRCGTVRRCCWGVPLFPAALFLLWALLIALLAVDHGRPATPSGTRCMLCAAAGHRRLVRLPAAAVRGGQLGRPARRAGPLGHRQRLGLCAVDGGVLHAPGPTSAASAAPRRPGVWFLPIYLGPDAGHDAGLDGAAQDDPHRAQPTASPRSPTSSPAATARARCWPGW